MTSKKSESEVIVQQVSTTVESEVQQVSIEAEKLERILMLLGFSEAITRSVVNEIYSSPSDTSIETVTEAKKPTNQCKSLKVRIRDLLTELAIPANILGYTYLQEAIATTVTDERMVHKVTKELYPRIAQKYDTTASRVERAIRHAIEIALTNCSVDVLDEYFGNSISFRKGKLTNSAFIAKTAELLRNDE